MTACRRDGAVHKNCRALTNKEYVSNNSMFSCIRRKKALRKRIPQRSLGSFSATLCESFSVCCSINLQDESGAADGNCSIDRVGFRSLNSEDDLIPHKLWDELFDSAFEAIGDVSIQIFEENQQQ